jgi:ubiquinone/menaquinone biosynthesis C-methylase UbiE
MLRIELAALNPASIYGNLRWPSGLVEKDAQQTEMSETQTKTDADDVLTPDPWEAAYLRFETPEEEIRKFTNRLNRLGAREWPRDAQIVELFCGRGNGLIALQRLGFTRLEGVDLSPRLIAEYKGSAKCIVADCRNLPFGNRSKDILIVQGGLHHLPNLPGDLDQTLSEMERVLRKEGRVVFVEPWLTPFLSFVHFVMNIPIVRRLSNKLDALATMTEHEIRTYTQWLGQPDLIQRIARAHFMPVHESFAWGKWNFVGAPK